MNRIIILVIYILQFCFCMGQDFVIQKEYYYLVKKQDVDTICTIKYKIENMTDKTKTVLFTEENVNEMSLEQLIRKKMFRRYGDFNIACWAWEQIENMSQYINFPSFFVKLIEPGGSFEITLLLRNENDDAVDSLFRSHLLLCDVDQIDNKEMVYGFVGGLRSHNAEYPYSSITIVWEDLKNWNLK